MLAYDRKIDGTTVLKTNNHALTDKEVVACYKDLARIERAFRDLKSVLDLRPIRHWKARRIASHVFLCVLALLLDRITDRKLKAAGVTDMTSDAAFHALKRVRLLKDVVNGIEIQRVSHIGPEAKRVLKALEITPPSPLMTVHRPRTSRKDRKSKSR